MMYHDGFDFQAGVVTSPFIAATVDRHLRRGKNLNLFGGEVLGKILCNSLGSQFEETAFVGTQLRIDRVLQRSKSAEELDSP